MDEQPSNAAPGDTDVARVDDALLQRWAFGRTDTEAERERAVAALAEIEQRAAQERAAANPTFVEPTVADPTSADPTSADPTSAESGDEGGATESEHPDTAENARQQRRMLRTGLAGVLAAALAVPLVVTQLTLPDPDPLAIFERPATAEELELVDQVNMLTNFATTAGPRVVFATDAGIAVAFRSSTIPGGQSTPWDVVCLSWLRGDIEGGSWGASPDCASPRRFASEGVVLNIGVITAGEPARQILWGPTGPPALAPLGATARTATTSPLELLALAGGGPGASLEGIGDSSRLLMGPTTVMSAGLSDSDEQLDVALFLQSSRATEGGEPLLCVRGFVTYAPAALGCRPLDTALTEGLTLYVPSRAGGWFIEVRPDGVIHTELVSEDSNVAVTTVPEG